MDTQAFIEKFPRKLWIGTLEFAVQFVPAGHAELKDKDADGEEVDLDGCTTFDPPAFWFCEALSLTKLLEIVRHELTHGVNHVGDIEDGADEETICRKHGEIWSQFSINNPRFERWWLSACIAVRKAQAGVPERKRS